METLLSQRLLKLTPTRLSLVVDMPSPKRIYPLQWVRTAYAHYIIRHVTRAYPTTTHVAYTDCIQTVYRLCRVVAMKGFDYR